jgi:DNA polymerase-3 subunit delta'
MPFRDYPDQQRGVELLQRSLERGRLGHGYLFRGPEVERLERLARSLAKTLNCHQPIRRSGRPIDCCNQCLPCQKIDHGTHADVHWVRPESKLRIITVAQMRGLMREIQLKPTEAEYKVAVVVGADRLNVGAANAFLKTLEEPPPKSILILLSTEPERILETVVSRCLRLSFGGEGLRHIPPALLQWLTEFTELAAAEQKSLLGRYRLMDVLLRKLAGVKAAIDEHLTARSPMQQYQDAEKDFVEKWEDELKAAIEAEYRRQRGEVLGLLQAWLRDVWLETSVREAQPDGSGRQISLLYFPQIDGTRRVAQRISQKDATENLVVMEQLQRWLHTNVQEALALEVGLLKLRL